MIGRDFWVYSGAAEKVACDLHLVCKVVPQLEQEVDICGAEATDEVVFESLDGSFCGVDAGIVGLDKLNGAVMGGGKCFDGSHSLIVGQLLCECGELLLECSD